MKKLFITICSIALSYATFYSQEQNSLPEQGNVGIGTLTPTAKLDVKGRVKIDGEVELQNLPASNSAANKDFVLIKADGSVEKIYGNVIVQSIGNDIYVEKDCTPDQIAHPMWANGEGKLFSNCPSVKVGVATNDPRFSLDVRGTSYSQRLALGELPTNTAVPNFYMKSALNQNTQSELFLIENTERKIFRINNDGTVEARHVIVNGRDWPDYVFEADYQLKPLEEVEAFLKEHKHLPEVPDAKTMEANGNSLADTDRILMQKVEELTLYLIEQNKVNQQQAELLRKQAQQIEELKQLLQK